jgi:hypothetical protein
MTLGHKTTREQELPDLVEMVGDISTNNIIDEVA